MTEPSSGKPSSPPVTLDAVDLRARVEHMSDAEREALPFGVIRLDADGKVDYYSNTEARQSGFGDRGAIGRLFFSQMAPCLGTPGLLARIDQAKAAGTLDLAFEHVGDFEDPDRPMRVRIQSSSAGGLWIFLQRLSADG